MHSFSAAVSATQRIMDQLCIDRDMSERSSVEIESNEAIYQSIAHHGNYDRNSQVSSALRTLHSRGFLHVIRRFPTPIKATVSIGSV